VQVGEPQADLAGHLTVGEPLCSEFEAAANHGQVIGHLDQNLPGSSVCRIGSLAQIP
jgi:hypothetical protein